MIYLKLRVRVAEKPASSIKANMPTEVKKNQRPISADENLTRIMGNNITEPPVFITVEAIDQKTSLLYTMLILGTFFKKLKFLNPLEYNLQKQNKKLIIKIT